MAHVATVEQASDLATPRGIVTPEAVLLEFETAGTGSRVLAVLVDLLILGMGLMVLMMGLTASFAAVGGSFPEWIAVVLLLLLGFVVLFGYWIGFEAWNGGKTPGKGALGLRVVTVEGAPITLRHAAIRGVFRLVDFYVTTGVVGVLTTTLSRRDQRLGDQFAGTIVLRERAVGSALGALTFPPPSGYEEYVTRLDVSLLTPEQYGVVRGFLARVFQVTPQARAALAERLSSHVVLAISQPVPSGMHPEVFLACVASAYQRRHPRHIVNPAATVPQGGWAAFQVPVPPAPRGVAVQVPPPPPPPPMGSRPVVPPPPSRPQEAKP